MKVEKWNGHKIRFVEKDGDAKIMLEDFLSIICELTQGKYRNPIEILAHEEISELSYPFVLTKNGDLYVKTLWYEIDMLDVINPFPVLANVKLAYKGVEVTEPMGIRNIKIRESIAKYLKVLSYERKTVEEDSSSLVNAGVYIIKGETTGLYKIGCSNDVFRRIVELSNMNADRLSLYCVFETHKYFALESQLHELFSKNRKHGEWFALDKEDLNILKDTVELMSVNEKFDLGLSVSKEVYKKYSE